MTPDLASLTPVFGLGVAGNFAGHLDQAGEAADFVNVAVEGEAPRGIFPWYAPGTGGPLDADPRSPAVLALPAADGPVDLQIEPEVAVLFAATYDAEGRVTALAPRAVAAFDDCSIRREGARKISEKKHWGAASKGISATALAVDDLGPDGPTATLRLAAFLVRDGVTHPYGIDSPLPGYTYYGATLVDWLVDRLREQRGSDDTPLEDVGALLRAAGCPGHLLVGIGATRYTDLGASTYLREGDEAVVVVYDGAAATQAEARDAVAAGAERALPGASTLRRVVRPA